MCRSAAERRRSARPAALALLVLLAAAGAGAETVSSPQLTGVEMTAPVRQTLKQLEEQWLQWIVQNDRQSAGIVVGDLLATARTLNMNRLPDLSAGALARAVQAAREKDFPRAQWALEAAERLDPGRPETAFATATVARLEGDWFAAFSAFARGYPRLFSHPLERYLWFQDLLVWTLCLLLLSGGLFVAVQMAARGGSLFSDLVELFGRRLPQPVAVAVSVLGLLWPLALPNGPLWLVFFWSLLLWGYASTSERVVMIALWLLVGLSPLLVTEQRRRVAVALSPPVQAMESLDEHRLYGGLFSDLGALRSLLPESTAVKHLVADVHRSLGQWELARSLYRQVLEEEPENNAALLNLGAYFFLKGDFGSAIQNFQKVATADPKNAAAYFNLSQAYSESYLFDEMKSAQQKARAIDDTRVSAWMNQQQRVVPVAGGLTRTGEIRRELLATWRTGGTGSPRLELFRRGLSVGVALCLILVAIALHFARRPFGYAERAMTDFGSFDRWGRALLPGLPSAEVGEGGRSFLGILLIAALLMLPLFGRLGYRIPWRYDPGNLASWIVAILGLSLVLGARLWRELRNDV